MKPWFEREQEITEFKEPVVYKGLNISVSKTKVKPPYIATITSPATGKEVLKAGGDTEQEALDSAKQAIDKREADAPQISAGGKTSVLLNTPSNNELLKDPSMYNTVYAKISKDKNGPTLVIGNEVYGSADLEASGFVGSYDRRMKKNRDSEEALPQIMFNANNKFLSQSGIKMNGRYSLDIAGKYRDEDEHTVYPLQFQGSTVHSGDRLRMNRPALTIGATREDIQPWFQRELEEAEVIKFPEPEKKVLQMPSVASYPDFITGVEDLKARRHKGDISQASHDKLYTDLIHRFMKKESFETPWFLREAPDELQQVKKLLLKQIGSEQELAVLKKMLSVMRDAGVDDKIAKALKTDADAEPLVQRLVADIMNTEGTVAEKQHFAENYTKGFINLNAILTANQKISINQILQNEMAPDPKNKDQKQTSFVYAVFDFLATKYVPPGVGPGEVALAVLSPSITRVGGGSSAIGDIKVSLGEKDYYVEMKGKNYNAQTKKTGTAGRLVDAKINIADPTGISNALQKVGQKGQRISLTPSARARAAIPLVGAENSVVSKLVKAGKDVNAFASEVAGALFSKVPGGRAKATRMIAANSEDILNFYTRTLYDRYYKIKSKAEKGKLAGFFFLNMQNKSFFFSTNFDATLDAGSTYDTPVYITDAKGDANNDARELAPAIVFK
tara:strand:- start:40 stop:2061 length:2022 start_codon:yes stop_codon:yes gene_type:complete